MGPLKSSVSPTFISPMCFDILPCSYVLTARSRWPFTFGRDSGVYGRMTLARLPSACVWQIWRFFFDFLPIPIQSIYLQLI